MAQPRNHDHNMPGYPVAEPRQAMPSVTPHFCLIGTGAEIAGAITTPIFYKHISTLFTIDFIMHA